MLISQMLSLCVVCCASCVVLLLSVQLFYGVSVFIEDSGWLRVVFRFLRSFWKC